MRHLWSFLAGLVVAPVTWVLVTLGQDGSSGTIGRWVEIGKFNTANLIEPAVYLAAGGILLGLLGTLRFSPVGPLLAGLLLVVPYIGMFVAPYEVRDRIPDGWKVLGDPLPLQVPVENGTLFLIGTMLIMAAFSLQRWRAWPAPASEPAPAESEKSTESDVTLTDWPPVASPERDTAAPITLAYPDSTPTEPLPRRTGGESPWSAPPRKPEDSPGIR
ncbi:hypothetical protein [Micromonospora musae]|uniref:Uncharacterized protein n=1 Tax=Micromonospora musae TaxID=1894970 RepID=A0A3A9XTD6_9ACTN|nr:hypothetical protein [Micromonospora musae]RKN28012.1 hypothetical protein D7044_27860 [Micromonospora musae]